MALKLRPLAHAHVGGAGGLLARAFADDPLIGRLLGAESPHSIRHRLAYPAFFRAALRDALGAGRVDAAFEREQLLGVAAWIDPMAALPSPQWSQRVDGWLTRLLYPDGVRRIETGFEELAPLHPVAPHRYLAFVGVDPAAQSAGIGSALLGQALADADAQGLACYLETPFARTIPFYVRLGFKVDRALPMTFGLGPLWTMLRLPSAPSRVIDTSRR